MCVLNRVSLSEYDVQEQIFSKRALLDMKSQMEAAGLDVDLFFRKLFESSELSQDLTTHSQPPSTVYPLSQGVPDRCSRMTASNSSVQKPDTSLVSVAEEEDDPSGDTPPEEDVSPADTEACDDDSTELAAIRNDLERRGLYANSSDQQRFR